MNMGLKGKKIYYGWVIVAASSGIGFANAATAIGILTIFVTPMSQEFGWTRTELAGATSLGALLGAALAPISGRIVDKLGSRVLLTLGGLIVAVSCSYLAISQTLIGFYVAFTLARIADQGLIKIGTAPAVGKWFSKFRGRATGIIFFFGICRNDNYGSYRSISHNKLQLEDRMADVGWWHANRRSDPLRLANPATA